ncbi:MULTISPECIES: glycerophosphoryl diester phosphodiesterase membrane domain-containing protein [unclassified Microcoleus]|uniref:glycerophosphoryl diester phosphodiesterase membrane domain-containing protein n=1 Tax=unclassified Microcoleus TaxID=2642155 RepID=UPI002FD596E6
MPKKNLSSSGQTGPLSVGNVVSAALRIYRDRFKLYFGLAFTAYLWLLVPIYGWAKYSAIAALISRLAFGEVSEHPETVSDARREVDPRMWNFFWAGVLTSLILGGVYLGGAIAIGLLSVAVGVAAGMLGQNSTIIGLIGGLLVVVAVIALLIICIRIFSQLFIVELPLAIENNLTASSAISRSWELTKGSVGRIQWIFFVGILVSLPITIVVQIIAMLVQVVLSAVLGAESGMFYLVYYLLILLLSFGSGALVTPFWQAMKAIIYYDLRSRKEGLGLQMRDR